MSLEKWQTRYILGGLAILPIAPFLYVQGLITRWKVGVLPDAHGPTGVSGIGEDEASLLVIGESTVAGLGARTHELALGGQFARGLSERIRKSVRWTVIGKNGVTARRTIDELWPLVPPRQYDYVLLGIGGNDVMKLSSPKKWRRDMIELIATVRHANPDAVIFISNCPMIVYSPVLPQPIKGILWELSKMHNANIVDFTSRMDRVYYFPQPVEIEADNFWADGIHPSEQGYRDWAAAMLQHFDDHHEW